MAFRDDLKTFMSTDLITRAASMSLASGDAYFGQHHRIMRADREIWGRYEKRLPLELEQGRLARHLVELQLFIAGIDENEEDNLADTLEDTAEELITAYEEPSGLTIFRAGLAAYQVHGVAIARGVLGIAPDRMSRWCLMAFQIDEWVR